MPTLENVEDVESFFVRDFKRRARNSRNEVVLAEYTHLRSKLKLWAKEKIYGKN
jgi:hypothetical protein